MSTQMAINPKKELPTLYLVDGSAYIYRAYHAIRSLSNSSGLPTNATFGFTRMLIKLMADRSPSHVAMFFDAKGPTFRHERYEAYKANRPPMPEDLVEQLPWIRKVTEAFNIPVFEMQGLRSRRSHRHPGPPCRRERAFVWSWLPETRISCSWSTSKTSPSGTP